MIRPFSSDDVRPIASMVLTTWEMDSYGHEAAMPSSEAYVLSCLARSDSAFAYEENGEVIGCVMYRSGPDRICCPEAQARLESMIPELAEMDGYSGFAHDIRVIQEADDRMLSSHENGFDCELVLLIVSERMRGRGVGRELYRLAAFDLKGRGCRRMMFFTDDDCGYGFYGRMGCRKLEEETVELTNELLLAMLWVADLDSEVDLINQ